MWQKAIQLLGVLNRTSSFLNHEQNTLVFDTVIKSHSNCRQLTWRFKAIYLINIIHERSLITVYDDT